MSAPRRPNAHGRVALRVAAERARRTTARRIAAEGLERIAAELESRRERAAAAERLAGILAHLRGPRLLRQNVTARLDTLLALTNESASDYEAWSWS